jgi:hypothetical protein
MMQEAAPVINPWLDPRFLWMAGVAVVALVLWFGRLEFKTNANAKRQEEYEETRAEERKAEREEFRELKKAFYGHATDTKVHHNEEMFKEFRSGLDRRFNTLETTLGDMNRKLDHLGGRD